MNTERDKFLTEAMGDCWHEAKYLYQATPYDTPDYECRCGKRCSEKSFKNNNFSTWEGFGKLWEWAQKQEWWIYLGFIGNYTEQFTASEFTHKDCIINPDRFADAVYNYLKEANE